MAILDEAARFEVWAEEMRYFSSIRDSLGLTKTDLRAAVDALDVFMNANATAVNDAIPEPAKTVLTKSQKARLLTAVIHRRWVEDS
jgi:hypothetical protein